MMTSSWYALPESLIEICHYTMSSRSRQYCSHLVKTSNRRSYSTALPSNNNTYEPTIGLELHVQLKTRLKLFSGAQTSYEAVPNTHIRPFDAGLPGALPVLNAEPVGLAMRAALALGCRIHGQSKFDRKHYFYPDLPPGFQITQKYAPLATGGSLTLTPRHDGVHNSHDIGVTQVQLEQDTAKSMHDTYSGQTLLDLNRAGTPLIEIISDPDMHSTEQAAAYVRKVQSILCCIGSSDADMEKGSMRIDVNVSIAAPGSNTPGTRCEIKNLNSVRSMVDAISYEVTRQAALLDAGEQVEQQTRAFDASTGTTSKLRSKSDAPDYRYMPDPELAPIIIPEGAIQALRERLPLLPDEIRDKLEKDYNLTPREVDILVRMSDQPEGEGMSGLEFFEVVAHGRKARTVANWILHDLLGQFTKYSKGFETSTVAPQDLGYLIDAVEENKITSTYGKNILASYFASDNTRTLAEMVKAAVGEVSKSNIDYEALSSAVIKDLPLEAEKVKKGNLNVLARLMGEGMKKSKGKAEAKLLRESLVAALK